MVYGYNMEPPNPPPNPPYSNCNHQHHLHCNNQNNDSGPILTGADDVNNYCYCEPGPQGPMGLQGLEGAIG